VIDAGQFGDAGRRLGLCGKPDAPKALRQRVADAGQPFGAESRDRLEAPIVRRGFEIREGLEAQFVVQAFGEDPADARTSPVQIRAGAAPWWTCGRWAAASRGPCSTDIVKEPAIYCSTSRSPFRQAGELYHPAASGTPCERRSVF
jgi:hypothetical protein